MEKKTTFKSSQGMASTHVNQIWLFQPLGLVCRLIFKTSVPSLKIIFNKPFTSFSCYCPLTKTGIDAQNHLARTLILFWCVDEQKIKD
jgi:hypothetical protein